MEHTIGLIIRMRAFPPASISFPQLLLIASKHEVTLKQARRYILTKYPQADFDWTLLSDGELAVAVQQCLAFVKKERNACEKSSQQYEKRLLKYKQLFDKVKGKYGLDSHIPKEAMLQQLKQRHQYFPLDSKDGPSRPQYQEFGTFVQLLQHIIHFQAEEQKYVKQNDKELTRKALSILTQLQTSIEAQLNEQRQAILNQFRQAESTYKSMLQDCKKDLQQIFLYYCMESNPSGSDFETYEKLSQMLGLRFYLKYFKDGESRQANGIHYSQADLIELFKKYSCNGRWINFNEFWAIHKRLFGIEEMIKKSKQKQYPAVELAALSQRYEEETERLQPLFTMISASGINDRVKKLSVSPPKLIRSRSLSLPQLVNHISPQKKDGLRRKLSFIQQVRHEISQQALPKSSSVNALPDILRLPSEKIESQGIYQSLKRFANYDYIAQQKKIKSIIGLSGTNEGFMEEFMRREQSLKVSRVEKEKSRVKEGHRKDGHSHERCRKYKAEQVEPYLRF